MNRLQYTIWVLISVWFMMSCTDEDTIIPDHSTHSEVSRTIKLNFSAPAAMDFTIARSSDISSDYLIRDLYVYVFDAESGNIVTFNQDKQPAPVHYFEKQLTNGITGAQEFKPNGIGGLYNANWIRFEIDEKAFDSEVYIYMIANPSLYTNILSIGGKDLASITNKQELDELVNIYHTNIQLDRTNFMMSGHTDATQSTDKEGNASASKLYITKDGTIVKQIKDETGTVTDTSDASITLERSEAKIEFHFKSGNNGTFTPKTFCIHNHPQRSNMICKYYLQTSFGATGGLNGEKIVNKDASHTKDDFFDTDDINIEGSSFSFYMPENLKYPGEKYNGGTLLGKESNSKSPGEGFKLRGLRDKEGNWKNAPTLATYVEIKGTYTGVATGKKQVTAEVTYFIHLGFSLNQNATYYVNDYYVKRNYQYIYTITVNGVNDIITEVNEGTDQTSAEGIVTWEEDITLTGSKPYSFICYKNESLAIDYTDSQTTNNWIQITKQNGGAAIPMDSPLDAKTNCIIKTSSLPEGTESRTATLKVTRGNEGTNSKTVRIFKITQIN